MEDNKYHSIFILGIQEICWKMRTITSHNLFHFFTIPSKIILCVKSVHKRKKRLLVGEINQIDEEVADGCKPCMRWRFCYLQLFCGIVLQIRNRVLLHIAMWDLEMISGNIYEFNLPSTIQRFQTNPILLVKLCLNTDKSNMLMQVETHKKLMQVLYGLCIHSNGNTCCGGKMESKLPSG